MSETPDPVDTELDRRQVAEQLLAQAKEQASISWAPAPFASQKIGWAPARSPRRCNSASFRGSAR